MPSYAVGCSLVFKASWSCDVSTFSSPTLAVAVSASSTLLVASCAADDVAEPSVTPEASSNAASWALKSVSIFLTGCVAATFLAV